MGSSAVLPRMPMRKAMITPTATTAISSTAATAVTMMPEWPGSSSSPMPFPPMGGGALPPSSSSMADSDMARTAEGDWTGRNPWVFPGSCPRGRGPFTVPPPL